MVKIQDMLENLGDIDANNDEPIPIYTCQSNWMDKVSTNKSVIKAWGDQFFKMHLEKISQIEKAADYLEVKTLCIDGQVFQRNFELFTTTEAFKNLSWEKLGLLLSGDGLNVPSEKVVFESLKTWISADPEERSASLEDLLPYIRASFLPSQFIDDLKNFLVKQNNPSCVYSWTSMIKLQDMDTISALLLFTLRGEVGVVWSIWILRLRPGPIWLMFPGDTPETSLKCVV